MSRNGRKVKRRREMELTKKIKEAIQKEKVTSEKEKESEIKGTAPPCEKQREPEPPPSYNPQCNPEGACRWQGYT